MVQEAAECIGENMSCEAIVQHLQKVRNGIETLFTLNTLEYLHKGGRIGKVSSLLGSILNIKPIIRVNDDGIYVPHGKARSQKSALQNLVQFCKDLATKNKPLRLGIAHGAAEDAARYLTEQLEAVLPIPVTLTTQVGPVIGVHTGPGTVGFALQMETE